MRSYVDRGGTFTDVVHLDQAGRLRLQKVPSDRAVIGDLAEGALCFGTTVATNALLERRGWPTTLVVTRGFGDLPHIGDMSRPALFDPDATWPPPLCQAVIELDERLAPDGTVQTPLDLASLGQVDTPAVAVALLHSPRNPDHERALGKAAREADPAAFVSLGHQVSPELGYLARIETALVDASITPVLQAALRRDALPDDALALRSDGSLCPWPSLAAPDAVLSGPAGGVLAVRAIAQKAGFDEAVGLDMGGTSTDVCLVRQGALPRVEGEARVAGVRLRKPMLEVETIAAGGGSILWSDGRRIGVGPQSAGADPGPQCYGRGGPPTLTDAAVRAGLVDPAAFDPPLATDRIELPGEARAFLEVAREAMAAAVRRLATARGADLSRHALVAYGGAGGQHAAEVAARLGIRTVLIHPCASVLCAFGQALARREEEVVRPLWIPLHGGMDALEAAWDALGNGLPELGDRQLWVDLRYQGTEVPLTVRGRKGMAASELGDAFAHAHRERYGFHRPGLAVELVNARVRVAAPEPDLPWVDADPWGIGEEEIHGRQVLFSPTTAVEVPEGWRARIREGLLVLEHLKSRPQAQPTQRTPKGLALWASRFMAVAEQSGVTLQRLARSVNIRERLDFSCAVFDGDGHLIANAPHIPVHLGAMGETVRDLLAHVPDPPAGQAWLSNAPDAGGSHLPDLTVISAVHSDGHRFFVASRGHHVDVGGLTPGSMPPHSTSLADEGLVVRRQPLLDDGALADLTEVLGDCREPETVRADLEAQVAANAQAARDLLALGPPELLTAWMAHLQDEAEEAIQARIQTLKDGQARDVIDGIPLVLSLRRDGDELVVDLQGTGGPHPGNLNAPPAVVRAAVLYGLRVLVGRPMPLNEGALRRVRLKLPRATVVHPPSHAAIAGGNVETSQRIVDLLLRAAGARAASQGTMNNLTLGASGWSLYETLGGGQGASAHGPGPSGMQVHMTNTRATDPEVLEARLPLRLRAFALRHGSGGPGRHRGGDGLVRELEVLEPCTAALLATRRDQGPPGLEGGASGLAGQDHLRRRGQWQGWDGAPVALAPGDRVRIESPGGGGWSADEG